MNINLIEEKIIAIEKCGCEIEGHVLEDELYREFIEFVSKSDHSKLSAMAKEVLKTKEIGFIRYYA